MTLDLQNEFGCELETITKELVIEDIVADMFKWFQETKVCILAFIQYDALDGLS